jgi:hypothetical protein
MKLWWNNPESFRYRKRALRKAGSYSHLLPCRLDELVAKIEK